MRRCAGRNILPLGLLYGEHCVRDQQEFQLAFEQAARAGINEVDVKAVSFKFEDPKNRVLMFKVLNCLSTVYECRGNGRPEGRRNELP